MARWIKTNETEEEVHSAHSEFTNEELHRYIPGSMTGVTLTSSDQGGLFMFMDDESILKNLPYNRIATELLHQHRTNLTHLQVFGDVVVAGLDETGEE